MVVLTCILLFSLGLILGTIVTNKAKRSKFWSQRIKNTRLRYLNVPVFGVIFGIISIVIQSLPIAFLALGAAISALFFNYIDIKPQEVK